MSTRVEHAARKTQQVPAALGGEGVARDTAQTAALSQLKQAADGAPATQRLKGMQHRADVGQGPLQGMFAMGSAAPMQLKHLGGTPLNADGSLKASALKRRIRLIAGTSLHSKDVKATLKAIDPNLAHWAKYTTPLYGRNNKPDSDADFAVHFYYNSDTGEVCTTIDYKKKFRDQSEEDI